MNTLKSWFHNFRLYYQNTFLGIDLLLLGLVVALVIFGLIMVYSSSFIFAQERTGDGFSLIMKQMVFTVAGAVALLVGLSINYQFWQKNAFKVFLIALFLVVLTLIPGIGIRAGGAQRWISFGLFNVQPSEFAKFGIIVLIASYLNRKEKILNRFSIGVVMPFIICIPMVFLLLKQPDFGTTAMIGILILTLMMVSPIPGRFIGVSLISVIVGAAILIWSAPYRLARLMVFLDPWKDISGKGFQIVQSWIGIHNGSLFGVGLGNGKGKLLFLPEAHNDFIFAVIGEELGFLGITALVSAFMVFIARGLRIAWNSKKLNRDSFGLYLATGITMALGAQALLNMAVVLGLVPTKGLPLPFISYGGSALCFDLFAIGVLLNIGRDRSSYE